MVERTISTSSCIQGKDVEIIFGFVRLLFACLNKNNKRT